MINDTSDLVHGHMFVKLVPGHAKSAADAVPLHQFIIYEQAAGPFNVSCKTHQRPISLQTDRALWLCAHA